MHPSFTPMSHCTRSKGEAEPEEIEWSDPMASPSAQNLTLKAKIFKAFRAVALIEGVTTLLLFFVAMPLKYWAGVTWSVPIAGQLHGYAFVAYVVLMCIALPGTGAGALGFARSFIASLFPFGTFLNEPYLKRLEAKL